MRSSGVPVAVGIWVLWFYFAGAAVAPAQVIDEQDRAAAAFIQHCSRCHGTDGGGGEGPTLLRAELEMANTDEELKLLIEDGLPATGMPAHWHLGDAQVLELVDYVRALGRIPPETLTGDPARGAAVYDENGCEACHVLAGVGRGIGPELSKIGLQRGLDSLRESLVDPPAAVSENYLFLRARLQGGGTLEGLRINEDEFTVQIRDSNGRFHTLEKSALDGLDRMRRRTIMRSYARGLAKTELEDLISFLATRRGDLRGQGDEQEVGR